MNLLLNCVYKFREIHADQAKHKLAVNDEHLYEIFCFLLDCQFEYLFYLLLGMQPVVSPFCMLDSYSDPLSISNGTAIKELSFQQFLLFCHNKLFYMCPFYPCI